MKKEMLEADKLHNKAIECMKHHKISGCFVTADGNCFLPGDLNSFLNHVRSSKTKGYVAGRGSLDELTDDHCKKFNTKEFKKAIEMMKLSPENFVRKLNEINTKREEEDAGNGSDENESDAQNDAGASENENAGDAEKKSEDETAGETDRKNNAPKLPLPAVPKKRPGKSGK